MYLHRADRDSGIRYLADRFPGCFFEEPTLRRPLKHNIIDDLEKENVLDREKLVQVLDWYQSHFTYRRGLIAGAERVDLDGKKARTVTPKEQQRDGRDWIAARKKEQAAIATLDAPWPSVPISLPPPRETMNGHTTMTPKLPKPILNPSLTSLQSAIAIVGNLMSDKEYEALRPVLATAALREVIRTAEGLIGELHSDLPADHL
jgi:ProQ/FINO family